jgi:N-acetylglucosaminyldiphosphoundecaprenol N-acetyl-beta-D-mannosaminyltransferase
MTKKIDILGLQLDNYTVREAIHQVEIYLENQELNTIEKVSAQMLIDSEHDPVLREAIASLDLAVIGDKEILQVVGIDTMQRIKETEEDDFFFEFFRRMERNKKTLFLLSETEDKLKENKERLLESFPRLIFAGSYALENCVGNQDAVINDMNATTPDVIISILPSPMQEHFFMEHKEKIGANIWYGMGSLDGIKKRHGTRYLFRSIIHRGRLKSSIEKYQKPYTE